MLRDRINEIAKYFITSIMNLTPQPYEIFAMSSSNLIHKKKFQVTLEFDVYEDFNPYEIQWNKIFQIEGQEHLDVEIRDTTDLFDDTW